MVVSVKLYITLFAKTFETLSDLFIVRWQDAVAIAVQINL